MIAVERTALDAPGFIDAIDRLIAGIIRLTAPTAMRVIEIDGWFDSKWLGFSGKLVGAVGIAMEELTVPPFHPHRVLREMVYRRREEGRYRVDPTATPIHREVSSEQNTRRHLTTVAPGTVCVWYSGASRASQRGAVMAYVPDGQDYWTWYAAFTQALPTWRITRRKGIAPAELERLLGVAAGAQAV